MTLCDYVIFEEKTGKVSLIGGFNSISADRFPVVAQPFSVFATLNKGFGDGTINLVISRLDTGQDVFDYRGKIRFPDKLTLVFFHARLRQCRFPAPGQYQFTLLVDGEWVAQRRLQVQLR
jgi:hypothetical protein